VSAPAVPAVPAVPAGRPGRAGGSVRSSGWTVFDRVHLDAWMLAAMTLAEIGLFWGIEPSWMNADTLQSVITQAAPLAVVAMAMTFSIISRHIDLSPGAMTALSGMVCALVVRAHGGIWLGALAALAVCLANGLLTGVLVSRLGLNSIMVTLACYIWARGLAYSFTSGNPIVVHSAWTGFVNSTFAGFTVTLPILLVVYALGGYALTRTRLGRYTHAIGGDPVGARRAGVPVTRYTTYLFLLMGAATFVASMIFVGQVASGQPSIGPTLELDAIVAVVIGGTRLAGGEGSVARTLLGVAFISVLNSGLINLGLGEDYFDFYKGAALLVVLGLQVFLRNRASAELEARLERERALAYGIE
jgi:ribose/xylose/arabinose/galactoside ABC-type transport system permease subunit